MEAVTLPADAAKYPGADCATCPLRHAPLVPPERNPRARVALVGEAPGRNEVIERRPFVGASGSVMNRALARLGLDRGDVHWTNAVLCAPQSETDLGRARKHCRERLVRELEPFDHVIVLGANALHSVANTKRKPRILKWRGFVHTVPRAGRAPLVVLPTVHPAFVMRADAWRPVFESDMWRIGQVLEHGFQLPERLQGRTLRLPRTLQSLRAELRQMGSEVAVDVETTGIEALTTQLVCLGISDGQRTVVVPWSLDKHGLCCAFGAEQKLVAEALTKFFAKRTAVTHNGPAFDHLVLERHGIKLGAWDDTLLAHHAFAGHMPKNLGHVVSMYADAPPWKEESHDDNLRVLYKYNARDALYTALAWQRMQPELTEERAVYEQDKQSALLCREMQRVGFQFDRSKATLLARKLRRAERAAQAQAARILGHEVNLLSQTQLRAAYFETLGAPKLFFSTKTGAAALHSVALSTYATMQNAHPDLAAFTGCVLKIRRARKIRGTYIEAIHTDADGRVHPSWLSYGAVSGRFACQNPNLMNLPRPDNDPVIKYGGVRSLYYAKRGHVLVGFDYSQLEMRIAAYFSGDEVMISACEASDLHAANAAVIFGEEFTRAEKGSREYSLLRGLAKQSGFAIAYMAGADTVYKRILAAGIPITLAQTERMLAKMRRTFQRYYSFQERLLLSVVRTGYVRIPISGRKRWLGHAPKAPECANTPIQGGAAGLINQCLPKIVAKLPRGAHLLAQVHDAAYFEVPRAHAEEVASLCRAVAEEPVSIGERKARFPIDVKIGERWSDL